MFHIILLEPEIPPNTGNIIRLAANTGCRLHLVEPLGFSMDEKRLRRAGLDYREWAEVERYRDFEDLLQRAPCRRIFGYSTRGRADHCSVTYRPGDGLLFGPETRGLPERMRQSLPKGHLLRLPMQPRSRSMNLSNCVAVVVYEAWRQQGFAGGL